jgi:peptidyl-dipeptidase Dcp
MLMTALLIAGCQPAATPDSTTQKAAAGADNNPLLQPWSTAFGVPPFDDIEDAHYLPAFRSAMADHKQEIAAINDTGAAPDFANTIEALERAGSQLTRVSNVFFAVHGAHSNDATREIASKMAPELAAHSDDILLDAGLFARVRAVYDQRDGLALDPEQQRLLDETHKAFVRAGANLERNAQQRLREINAELASLSEEFDNNLLAETNDFELLVTDTADLGELPQSLIAAAKAEASRRGHECDCWVFTLQRPSINPFLEYSPDRELRKQIFSAYAMRGDRDNDADNNGNLAKQATLRIERAKLLGYASHADYVLADSMAETPQRVYELLDQIWAPAVQMARSERDALQKMMAEDGIDDALQGWDWRYYTEKVRKARYSIDQEALRPYFEFTAVRDGAFAVANKLFGLTFEQREDLPKWHPDQQVFEVREADGTHLAILYMDFFARESKRGGAWMNALRSQSKMDAVITPIVTNNFNFPPPTADSPSLLSLTEAETLFHEFGHALHGMLSNVTYESLSGTNTPRDFVEFPSQVMENWMSEPAVLRLFARHHETGAELPEDVIERLSAASKFNQGFKTVEYMAASYLDMAYHTLSEPLTLEPRAFERSVLAQIGLMNEIIPRYRSSYFAHIFAGGYSAGYYSYIWSEVLDADAFEAFKETSLFDPETAAAYREHILSKGGTRPGMELYLGFRGRAPEIEPLLEKRGLQTGI